MYLAIVIITNIADDNINIEINNIATSQQLPSINKDDKDIKEVEKYIPQQKEIINRRYSLTHRNDGAALLRSVAYLSSSHVRCGNAGDTVGSGSE